MQGEIIIIKIYLSDMEIYLRKAEMNLWYLNSTRQKNVPEGKLSSKWVRDLVFMCEECTFTRIQAKIQGTPVFCI